MSNRFKAIAGITGIFLLGGICGALLIGLIIRDNVRERAKLRDHEGFIAYFERRLELTEAQRDSLRDELDSAYNRLVELRRATSEEYNAVIDTMSQRIYPQLTPEQRELFKQQEQALRRMVPKERGPRLAGRGDIPPPSRQLLPETSPGEGRPLEGEAAATARSTERAEKLADSSPKMAPPTANSPRDSAAPQPDDPERFSRSLSTLKDMLDLSNDQMVKIDGVIDDVKARNRRARAELADSPGLLVMTLRANNRDMRRNVLAILTPEQMQKFEQIKKDRQRSGSAR